LMITPPPTIFHADLLERNCNPSPIKRGVGVS
jgi:hypothetical protein